MEARVFVALLVALLGGVALAALGLSLVQGASAATVEPTFSSSFVGGCADDPATESRVVQVHMPDRKLVAIHHTLTAERPFRVVHSTLTERGSGSFVYEIHTETVTDKPDPNWCGHSSRMDATVELPFRFETLTVVVDGDPIAVVENAHTDRVVVQPFPAS